MYHNKTIITQIISKYLQGKCEDDELKIIDTWLKEHPKNQELFNQLKDTQQLTEDIVQFNSFDKSAAWNSLLAKLDGPQDKGKIRPLRRYVLWSAAVALVIAGFFFYQYLNKPDQMQDLEVLAQGKVLKDERGEILPATTGAIIITSSGKQLSLDDSFKINDRGQIENAASDALSNVSTENEISYYELIVPKAKTIQFTMFDGTRVWVNANSRLKIPTHSRADERRISILSGEAYFEVEKYDNKKFVVETPNGQIEVLGTKFNVNSVNKIFKTTLLEGRVKLSNEQHETILAPNTSATLKNNEFIVTKANLNADLSWKNNTFYFSNYTIGKIAQQIEDWYGVKVHVGREVTQEVSTYSGELRRDVPLTEVRKMLEFISGLDVTIEGEQLNINY